MSTDSSFNDKRPDSVPTTPEEDIDPVMDPNRSVKGSLGASDGSANGTSPGHERSECRGWHSG